MDSQIKISFILPCYNTGLFLRQCVQSLLKQGFKDNEYEIICVDNAATDNTAEILSELSEQFSQIRVVTLHVNQCSGGAYNAGLSVAKGKYILFVDSDDYLKEFTVLKLYDMMESENLEMLQFNLIPFSNENNSGTLSEKMIFNSNLLYDIPVCSGGDYLSQAITQMDFCYLPVPAYRKIYLRDFLKNNDIQFTPTTLGTDFLHMMYSLRAVNRMKSICEKVYYYRYNPSGVSKVKVTSAKIEYALGNYSEAYSVVDGSNFAPQIKKEIQPYITKTIQSYIGEIVELSKDQRESLLSKITNKDFLSKMSRSFIQRSCFDNYRFFSVLACLMPRKILKRL